MAQHVIPPHILKRWLISTILYKHLIKNFIKTYTLPVFVIIKLAMLTNPSKWSTFNIRLVPDKSFRMIAPTVSGRCANKLVKIFIDYCSYFPQFYCKSYQDVGFR